MESIDPLHTYTLEITMSKTPYELRFEIYRQAYAQLCDAYHSEWQAAESKNDGKLPSDFDSKPPTLAQILQVSSVINDFVSEAK